jgi:hypothetical protein
VAEPPAQRALPFTVYHLPFLAFLLLSIAWTWPLATRLTTRIPHDPGDSILNTWILWWNAQAVPFTDAWWNAPVFFPMRDALALSEHLAGLSIFSTPLMLAGLNPLGAYNVVLILTVALSGFFAYLLVLRLTGSRVAAMCGGLAYAFSPYRASQLGHLQVLASHWMPLVLLAMHEYIGGGRRLWLGVLAVAWLLQALSNGYYLLFLPVLIALWLAWFVRWRTAPQRGLILAGVWIASSMVLVPVLLKYHAVHQRLGLTRSFEEIRTFSADPGSFLRASSLMWLWPYAEPYGSEDQLFPGILPIALVAAMAVVTARAARSALKDAVAARSAALFYAIAAVFMWMLAFGPADEGATAAVLWHPYTILTVVPGFNGLRVPARFAMLGTLCIAVAAGLAVERLAPRGRHRTVFAALLIAGFVADGWMKALPLFAPPMRVPLPAIPNAVVVELPPEDSNVGVASMYRSMFHGRPVVSGYSGHLPPHTLVLATSLHHGDPSALLLLAQNHPLVIVVDERHDPEARLRELVRAQPGAQRHMTTGAGEVYVLPQSAAVREAEPGAELPSREEGEGQSRQIDLGASRVIRTIGFTMWHRHLELAPRVTFETSADGVTWTKAWEDWTGASVFAAVLRDARSAPVRIALPDVSARYVRFGPVPEWVWSEIKFYGP